nr:MAG TPA: HEMOGLOBIN ZETA CHAIN, HEMOGLOBIN BETA-SINGLE transport, OXYGEN STORAGE-TRANSPORT COMPLEX [Caudoviricetes sp.]
MSRGRITQNPSSFFVHFFSTFCTKNPLLEDVFYSKIPENKKVNAHKLQKIAKKFL